jgi:hypothetical protein
MHWTHYALLAVCLFAYWQRNPAISRVATVFLANAGIMTLWALLVDPVIDPRLQLAVDLVSAGIVMGDPADREQGWIGLLFGVRIGASIAFIQSGIPEAAYDYWHLMNMVGQVMMVALLLWSEGHGGQLTHLCRRGFGLVSRRVSRALSNSVGA